MKNRRAQSIQPLEPKRQRGRCVTAICFSWKVLTCIVSHVTLVLLVVAYCVCGAYLFQHLEKPHEIEVKREIRNLRLNLTDRIWKFSYNASVLSETDWISSIRKDLSFFEKQILTAMKSDGWDGDEDISKSQWTFAGSLFYSIIVITTIGYGHISPRTDWGKVTTIFYAIIGIPLMLLCLSNIGDVMATSFRFTYWRVCCYLCTRAVRRPRPRSARMHRYSSRSQPPPLRRSMKHSQRGDKDSWLSAANGLTHAYSDPELCTGERYDFDRNYDQRVMMARNHLPAHTQRNKMPYQNYYHDDIKAHQGHELNRSTAYGSRQHGRERATDRHTIEREQYLSHSRHQHHQHHQHHDSLTELNVPAPATKRTMSMRSFHGGAPRGERRGEFNRVHTQSLPRERAQHDRSRIRAKSVDTRTVAAVPENDDADDELLRRIRIISNRYAIKEFEHECKRSPSKEALRSQSLPRYAHTGKYHQNAGKPNPHGRPCPSIQESTYDTFNESSMKVRETARYGNQLELPEMDPHYGNRRQSQASRYRSSYEDKKYLKPYEDDEFEEYPRDARSYPQQRDRNQRRGRSERLPPSPRIMSPMGFAVKRQVRRRMSFDNYDDSNYGDEWDLYNEILPKDRPVPIWLCVFLVVSYILGGAALFAYWEKWSFLDSAYFCFITLTTIGFGDFVPAKGVRDESEQSIAYCSLYLLFGIALLAMSFNLVQEEFIANVKEVARRLGILRDEDDYD